MDAPARQRYCAAAKAHRQPCAPTLRGALTELSFEVARRHDPTRVKARAQTRALVDRLIDVSNVSETACVAKNVFGKQAARLRD